MKRFGDELADPLRCDDDPDDVDEFDDDEDEDDDRTGGDDEDDEEDDEDEEDDDEPETWQVSNGLCCPKGKSSLDFGHRTVRLTPIFKLS